MNREYAEKVEILLRLLPIVMDEKVFAVHGGSAINLFVRDLPRYSVDIDLTYIPLEGREESLAHISEHLTNIADKAFLISFEQGAPDWKNFDFSYFKDYPSIQWKQLNLQKLQRQNPAKLTTAAAKLSAILIPWPLPAGSRAPQYRGR